MKWAIKVVWKDGEEEYLKGPRGRIATFFGRSRAEDQAEFMREGMESDVQSINVVRAPRALAAAGGAAQEGEK